MLPWKTHINDTCTKDQKVIHGLSCDHVKSNLQPKIVVLINFAFKEVHMCPLQLTKSESSFWNVNQSSLFSAHL